MFLYKTLEAEIKGKEGKHGVVLLRSDSQILVSSSLLFVFLLDEDVPAPPR